MNTINCLKQTLTKYSWYDEIPETIEDQIELLKDLREQERIARLKFTKEPTAPAKDLTMLIIRLQMQLIIRKS